VTTNKKITELAELTEANLSDDDVLAIVDVSANTTNKVRKSTLASALAGVASLSATSPVTVSAGTGAVNIAVTTIPITSGGTGATTAADARTNLGVPAPVDVSGLVTGPASATDSALALFNGTTGKIIKDSTYTITAAGAALIDDASASAQRTTLGAAASGANTDITSLGGLTTDIAVADGGTGAGTAGAARTNLGAAASGSNSDITALTGLTTDIAVADGGTGGSTAAAARSNLGAAALGSNSDITALTGLTTDLSVAQGGTGASTHTSASVLIGAGASPITSVAPSTSGNLLTSTGSAWTSAAPAPGGSMVLLNSGTVSAASSLAIEGSSYINDDYVRYVLHYEQTASLLVNGPVVTFRQESTGSYLSSLYYSAEAGVSGAGGAQVHSYYNTSYLSLGVTLFHPNHPGNIEMTFYSLRASDCFSSLAFHGGYPEDYYSKTASTYGIGGVRNNAVVDGMKWTAISGSFTGRYWWYGLKGS
jgi:hypothetical protein